MNKGEGNMMVKVSEYEENMKIQMTAFHKKFIRDIKKVTTPMEDKLVNDIIGYYQAIEAAQKNGAMKFGTLDIGLMEDENHTLYLMVYFGKKESGDKDEETKEKKD